MKEYDREKKKWVSVDAKERELKLKKRKMCRGGRPHNFVLVLPMYVHFNELYKFNPEEYYKIMEEYDAFIDEQDQKFKKLGIVTRFGGGLYGRNKTYMCSVCKKVEYNLKQNA